MSALLSPTDSIGMVIFSWIVLGLASLLLAGSGVCWAVFLVFGHVDWRNLAVKTFRLALVPVLFYVNVVIYVRIVTDLT